MRRGSWLNLMTMMNLCLKIRLREQGHCLLRRSLRAKRFTTLMTLWRRGTSQLRWCLQNVIQRFLIGLIWVTKIRSQELYQASQSSLDPWASQSYFSWVSNRINTAPTVRQANTSRWAVLALQTSPWEKLTTLSVSLRKKSPVFATSNTIITSQTIWI